MTDAPVKTRKKLIEVALPLEAINEASGREKSIRHGHPSTLHLWWARRPLAAARAVIFSQMIDDPSEYVDVLREDPKLRRKAESILKVKHAAWQQAHDLAEKAEGSGLDVPAPGLEPTLDEILSDQERQRLFRIVEQLVRWENTTNEAVLQSARDEIWASWRRASLDNVDHPQARDLFDRHNLPAFHDPFAGGGALPLEAQRLGLEAYASDLNPVSVLINKAMIDIPPRFAGRPPVNPDAREKASHTGEWPGASGLAEDVRYYGRWMREEAERRLAHLYPTIEITADLARERSDLRPYVGRSLTVVAWLWARTVKSPNPAFAHVDVPLVSSFVLAGKPGKEAYVRPEIRGDSYHFRVIAGSTAGLKAAAGGTKRNRANFTCLLSGSPIPGDYIKDEAQAGRMNARLMTIVVLGDRERLYLDPTPEHEGIARQARPEWQPDLSISGTSQYLGVKPYGLDNFGQLFMPRQLVCLETLANLALEARLQIQQDITASSGSVEVDPLHQVANDDAYAAAIATFLGIGVARYANASSTLCSWNPAPSKEDIRFTFSRQALQMTWDFAEGNPFSTSSGNFADSLDTWIFKSLLFLPAGPEQGVADSADATDQRLSTGKVVSTDPPYYDNVPYADLSDFFYVWLRRALRDLYPDLFATIAVPKAQELVAFAYRHRDGKAGAEAFFLDGMTRAMRGVAMQSHPAFPVTIYYAFRQTEEDHEGSISNTGWETFLAAVRAAGFAVTGTWPMRTERQGRTRDSGSNALASSIVLVCRRRDPDVGTATRRDFIAALKAELPGAVANLQRVSIAPTDLAQAAIGPGMAVFTRYSAVLDAAGNEVSIRDALRLINQALDEVLAEQEGDFDADSRWALSWYEQVGFAEGEFGVADVLARAKNTSVLGMQDAGIIVARGGRVRLLAPKELDPDWDPTRDRRRPAWEAVHHLVAASQTSEAALAALIVKLGPDAETARELAYRLYVLSERKKRPTEAGWYNGLVQSWGEATRLAAEQRVAEQPVQGQLFGEG